MQFSDPITSLGLVQHIREPTHEKGYNLDLVITRIADSCLSNWTKRCHLIILRYTSHHIHTPPPMKKVTKQHQRLSAIVKTDFRELIEHSLMDIPHHFSDDDQLAVSYNTALSTALNEVAPLQVRTLLDKLRAKWYTKDLMEKRTALRHLEKHWLVTCLEVDKQAFVSARSLYNRHCDDS